MFDLGMRTFDLEQESRSTHAPSFGVIAFRLCYGFLPSEQRRHGTPGTL
jgi:hypothetical protein